MDERLSLIYARRSVRRYTDEPVTDEEVRELLEAGMAAPSACAKDPWRIVVIRRRDRLARIAEGLPNGKMLATASVGLAVCGDLDAAHGGELSYMLQDCSALIENILLAATGLGLGACWLGVHPREERVEHLRQELGIPTNVVPMAAIAVGRPADSPSSRTRFDADKVFEEQFGA